MDGTYDELRNLLDCTPEMLAIVTIDWCFHRANLAWKRIIDNVGALRQTSILDLIYPDDLWLVTQELEFFKKRNTPLTFTARCKAKDGECTMAALEFVPRT